MRVHDIGAFFRVTCSESDVEEFARRWPCYGARRPVAFEFHKESGDLVDVTGDSGMDESGVRALSEDAQEYGAARLGLATRESGPWDRNPRGVCSVYRFGDSVGIHTPGGPTVYLTPAAAEALAGALKAAAASIRAESFAESSVGTREVDPRRAGRARAR